MKSSPDIETVKFDLLGQRRLILDKSGVRYQTNELYPVPAPILGVVSVHSNQRLDYDDLEWVGIVRKKQLWAAVMAVFGCSLGLFWTYVSLNQQDMGALVFSVGFLLLIGCLPFFLYIRGRRFLAIATGAECIAFPADRKRRQVRRAIQSLRRRCANHDIEWEV